MPHDRYPRQDQNRDHEQAWWPWAGRTVLAVNLRIIDDRHRLGPPSRVGQADRTSGHLHSDASA
jgi:hypothetical protein